MNFASLNQGVIIEGAETTCMNQGVTTEGAETTRIIK